LEDTSPLNIQRLPPLSIYVHIPWCIHKCPYCDFNSHEFKGQNIKDNEMAYTQALIKQIGSHQFETNRPVQSIFFGGGTPSLFSPQSFEKIIQTLKQKFSLAEFCEITIEANPGTIDKEYFYGYQEIGINRMSLGIQTFNDKHLKKLERIHSQKEAYDAATLAIELFNNVNIDLMFALPNQTLPELNEDIEEAINLHSTHLSYYQLTLEPNTYFYNHPPALPDQDESAEFSDLIKSKLMGAKFEHYETSAYAKRENKCNHNLNYWRFGDYLGIGAGAHSKITNDFNITRFSTYKNPKQYIQEVNNHSHIQEEQLINKNDIPFEFMMNALRLNDGFTIDLFEQRTGLSLSSIDSEIKLCLEKGLLDRNNGTIKPTLLGQNFLNNLLQIFLRN
jgi:putative oxygen-independent coproporphyrinogen III oxidase|tara:strand:+ start:1720 stop:2892 length:1173 start_codon:yes stop_codon:yes gene_type:complete